jgi:hypothetical protein
MSTATPLVNPATHCPSCGEEVVDAKARFCARCGRQLMRPDLRAHHIVNDGMPSVTLREGHAPRGAEPPPDLAATPHTGAVFSAAPLVAWPPPVAAPATSSSSNTQRGLAGALGAGIVLALLAISATVILAVTHHDPPTPNVSQNQPAADSEPATTTAVP